MLATIGAAVPAFWLGLVLLFVLYYRSGLLPGPGRIDAVLAEPPRITGMILIDSAVAGDWTAFRSGLRHMILPAIVLAGYPVAMLARLTRASLLEALGTDYTRTARAKGLSEQRVIGQHALRNALIPTVTAAGLAFGYLLAGAVTVEIVFSWPGIGRYAVNAASSLTIRPSSASPWSSRSSSLSPISWSTLSTACSTHAFAPDEERCWPYPTH